MNEVKRIIQKGIVSEDFLKPETICDFYVDENRKKIWAVMLDLFYELKKVCDKLGIEFYASGGTLLGAVRHRGFIPWDDDMDFWMKREDYEKLYQHADEFKEPYFLQTPYTDNGYYYSAIKLRNSNTTNLSEIFLYENWNMGIGIDIFPIDKYISSELVKNYSKIGEITSELSTYMRMSNPYLDDNNKKRVENYCGRAPLELYEELEAIAQQYNDSDEADCYLEIVNTQYKDPFKKIIHKEDLDNCVYLDFENTKIPAYNGYLNHLKAFYGDYMQMPPMEKRGVWHEEIFSPDIPYKEYVSKMRREKEEG